MVNFIVKNRKKGMQFIDQRQVVAVKEELARRREALIQLARSPSTPIDPLDRSEIVKYLAEGGRPERPEDVPSIMKAFLKSCYTYAVLRSFSTKILGEIPTPDTMPILLTRVFSEPAFKHDDTWLPPNLKDTALRIQEREHYDHTSREPRPRMIRVMLDGSEEMTKRLSQGLDNFFAALEQVSVSPPEEMWSFVKSFSRPIYHVGPALICDFIKEIGFLKFVKVDHHFLLQFSSLVPSLREGCSRLSNKEHFVLSQQLADAVGMEPYYLDRILYEWGRYGNLHERDS